MVWHRNKQKSVLLETSVCCCGDEQRLVTSGEQQIRTDEFPEAAAFLFSFSHCNKIKLRIEEKQKANIVN